MLMKKGSRVHGPPKKKSAIQPHARYVQVAAFRALVSALSWERSAVRPPCTSAMRWLRVAKDVVTCSSTLLCNLCSAVEQTRLMKEGKGQIKDLEIIAECATHASTLDDKESVCWLTEDKTPKPLKISCETSPRLKTMALAGSTCECVKMVVVGVKR